MENLWTSIAAAELINRITGRERLIRTLLIRSST